MRRLDDFIKRYVEHLAKTSESPLQYHWWACATIIAASLKRNVWVDRGGWCLYPNLYTCLIGKPSVGKSAAIRPASKLITDANVTGVSSDRITIQKLLQRLADGFTAGVKSSPNGKVTLVHESAAILVSSEFSNFATTSEDSLRIMADLWDSGDRFEYATRHVGEFVINSPCLSMLAGSSVEWLMKSLPASSIGGGFTRRVNFVYAKDPKDTISWPEEELPLPKAFVDDLQEIAMLKGKFTFTKSAKEAFSEYYAKTRNPEYEDQASTVYAGTKPFQVLKLTMAISAATRNDLVVTDSAMGEAISRIEQCGRDLKIIFRGVGDGDLTEAMRHIVEFVEMRGYATRADILQHNWNYVNAQTLDVILATLTQANLFFEKTSGRTTVYYVNEFEVAPKKEAAHGNT